MGVQDDNDIGRGPLGALLPRRDKAAALREAHHLRDRHVLRKPRFQRFLQKRCGERGRPIGGVKGAEGGGDLQGFRDLLWEGRGRESVAFCTFTTAAFSKLCISAITPLFFCFFFSVANICLSIKTKVRKSIYIRNKE